MRAIHLAAAAAVALVGCKSSTPPADLAEVRVHATVGEAAIAVLVQGARARGIAAVRVVQTPDEAEVFWLGDPAEVVALGARVQRGALPQPPDTDARLLDPVGRFLPVCARGRVLLVNPRAQLPFEPQSLRDLADRRAAGRVAVPDLTSDEGIATVAALTLTYGNAGVSKFLAALAQNDPIVVATDAEVRDRVARGEAALGLVRSEAAAAAAASAAGLDVVVPDQLGGRGAVLLPTAVAVAENAPEAAARLARWLGGAEAEALLAARVPGLMPLRSGVPVPVGVHPTSDLKVLILDWDRFAAEKEKVRASLAGWPESWRREKGG